MFEQTPSYIKQLLMPNGKSKGVTMVRRIGTTFRLGKLVWTRGVNDEVAKDAKFSAFVSESIRRHTMGDWGDLSQEDKNENDLAVKAGDLRILSAYEKDGLPKIWIITEADRSATTILFPEEY